MSRLRPAISRPPVPPGRWLALALVPCGASYNGVLYDLGQRGAALGAVARLLDGLNVAFIILLYLFPDGRFVPRWTRWPAALALGLALAGAAFPRSPVDMGASP